MQWNIKLRFYSYIVYALSRILNVEYKCRWWNIVGQRRLAFVHLYFSIFRAASNFASSFFLSRETRINRSAFALRPRIEISRYRPTCPFPLLLLLPFLLPLLLPCKSFYELFPVYWILILFSNTRTLVYPVASTGIAAQSSRRRNLCFLYWEIEMETGMGYPRSSNSFP